MRRLVTAVAACWLGGCHLVFELEDGPDAGDVCADPSLKLCLTFDDDLSDTQVEDRSGTGNHANVPADLTTTPRGDGTGVEVDIDAIIEIPQHASLDITGPMTLDMWFGYAQAPVASAGLLDNDAQYGISLGADLRVSCEIAIDDLVSYAVTSSAIGTRPWQYVACVRRLTTLELWLDGILVNVAMLPPGATETAGDQPLYVGRDGDTQSNTWTNPLTGRVDDVRIFDRALDAGEIEAYYEATK